MGTRGVPQSHCARPCSRICISCRDCWAASRTSSTCGIPPISRKKATVTRSLTCCWRYGTLPRCIGHTRSISARACSVCGAAPSRSTTNCKRSPSDPHGTNWWTKPCTSNIRLGNTRGGHCRGSCGVMPLRRHITCRACMLRDPQSHVRRCVDSPSERSVSRSAPRRWRRAWCGWCSAQGWLSWEETPRPCAWCAQDILPFVRYTPLHGGPHQRSQADASLRLS